ncbi:MAG: N-acetyl-gamma-glutamyl-phosphate reductase [Planctomycetes bacterium]|nr:N-acetyl-gamma-glutamyl-phosphate reductase [Planctomycetota bacterium]
MKRRIAILGATGYTGREVLRIARNHPDLEVAHLMTARAGVDPEPPDLDYDPPTERLVLDKLREVDGVFLCTPHGAAGPLAAAALELGCKVVDLSADFRLRDERVHRATYGDTTPGASAGLRDIAVYGLTEHARDAVRGAQLVANPGCYPTAVSLPLLPLLAANLVDLDADVVADCKSGMSGAGRTPKQRTHFGDVHENFCAYSVGDHRHVPEMHQMLGTDRLLFVPHLLPVFRGILATLWVRPAAGVDATRVVDCLRARYAGEPFVRVYARGLPELDRVRLTNFCDVGVRTVGNRIVLISAIDNLVKGAAGQAVQNMNLMLGLDETAGLLDGPARPEAVR